MKRIKGLLVCLLAVGLLTGCSDDSPKKAVCTGILDGADETITLIAEGDNLTEWIETAKIPLSSYGITAEQYANDNSLIDTDYIKDNAFYLISGDTEAEGIEIDVSVEDENIVINVAIDYTVVDIDMLIKTGYVEEGEIATSFISYSQSLEGYEESGLTCTEK